MADYEPELKRVLEVAGGPAALARALNIVPSAVTQWRKIPPNRVPQISEITGIPRHELRPDLWEPPES